VNTTNRLQNERNLARLGKLAAAQNNQADDLWLEWTIQRLQQATSLLRRRMKALGIPAVAPEPPTGSEVGLLTRYFGHRSAFWRAQKELGTALAANKGLSSEYLADMTMLNTRLAQSLSCDFRGIGFNGAPVKIEVAQQQIGKRLAAQRREKKLSQAALGETIGLSGKTIARIEGGKQRLSIVQLYFLARSLGISVADLIPRAVLVTSPEISPDQADQIQAAWPAFNQALEELKEGKRKLPE